MHLNEGSTTISDIPDACLAHIYQRLDSACAREAFGLTCRRWLCIQNISHRSLQFYCSLTHHDMTSISSSPESRPLIGAIHLNRLLDRFRYLHSLSLSGCTLLRDSGLTPLGNYGPSLRGLYLDCCFCITDCGLYFVADGCPSLAFISLYRCNITDIGLATLAKSCSVLESVNLSYCSTVTDHGISMLLENCRELSALNISNCAGINGTGFKGRGKNLIYLEAESCSLEPGGITGIVSGGKLEYLNTSILSWSIHGDGLAAIGAGYATRLRILNMRLCRTVGNDVVTVISKGCPMLQEWNLALCHEVGLPGWQSIALNCHNLKKLHVNRCRNFCDLGLMALRDGCKQLRVLYMNGCAQVSSNGVEFFKLVRGDVVIKAEEVLSMCPLPRLFG
ncbi:hypothetical protein Droror1_Dr00003870 [Drosera rotundifolia]